MSGIRITFVQFSCEITPNTKVGKCQVMFEEMPANSIAIPGWSSSVQIHDRRRTTNKALVCAALFRDCQTLRRARAGGGVEEEQAP